MVPQAGLIASRLPRHHAKHMDGSQGSANQYYRMTQAASLTAPLLGGAGIARMSGSANQQRSAVKPPSMYPMRKPGADCGVTRSM
jgi:hypothetical protein